jgi:hypothetical protein
MKKWAMMGVVMMSALAAAPLSAQFGGRLSLEPYIGYGFFGDLPEEGSELGAALAYGGRVGYQFGTQWGLFGNFQRSNPEALGSGGGSGTDVTVDHWSAGVEFSYVPRGGAERMLPILLEAGLGQARYDGGASDLAVNLGLASAIEMTPNIRIRYGVNDYISNYGDDRGIVNQIFVRAGVELSL